MLSPIEFFDRYVELMNAGGLAMWVLFVLNLFLWYGLGYRYFILRRGTEGSIRRLIKKHQVRKETQDMRGILDYAVSDALRVAQEAEGLGLNVRKHIRGALMPYLEMMDRHRVLIRTIVVLAPLVGLLGTVVGMIETFDALQNSSMFSQGASIAGGISKALFTTELGLVVAVPGLILGRALDKKEDRFELEFEQMTDIIATKEIVNEN